MYPAHKKEDIFLVNYTGRRKFYGNDKALTCIKPNEKLMLLKPNSDFKHEIKRQFKGKLIYPKFDIRSELSSSSTKRLSKIMRKYFDETHYRNSKKTAWSIDKSQKSYVDSNPTKTTERVLNASNFPSPNDNKNRFSPQSISKYHESVEYTSTYTPLHKMSELKSDNYAYLAGSQVRNVKAHQYSRPVSIKSSESEEK